MRTVLFLATVALCGLSSISAADLDLMEVPEPEQPSWLREADMPAGFPVPGAIGAVIEKTYPAHRSANSTRFRPLFQHIKRNDIAMTTPVSQAMTWNPDRKRWQMDDMRFIYRQPGMGSLGPDPSDDEVVVTDRPQSRWLSITLRGSRSGNAITAASQKLQRHAEANNLAIDMEGIRMLSYNSPFVPGPFQLWEIQVPLN